MKFCQNCGSEMLDNMRFCMNCGADYKAQTSDTEKPAGGMPPDKASGKRAVLIVCAVLIIALAVSAVYIAKNFKDKPNNENATNSISPIPTDEIDTASDKKWNKAFADYFEEISNSDGFSENSDAYIVDLDGDSIPEAIGGWHGFLPMIAYYDDGEIKEVYLPDDNIAHSTASAGEEPNALFFDTKNHIIVQRCVGRNTGTMFHRIAVAYKYNQGTLTEYKSVSLDLKPEDFENTSEDEAYQLITKRFNEQFEEFVKEFVLTAFSDVAYYFKDLAKYFSNTFGYDIEIISMEESELQTKPESTTANRIPELTDDNAFEYLKSAFDAYSAGSLYYLTTEYDIYDTVKCERINSEWNYEQGTRWMNFDNESEYYNYQNAISDGHDIRVKNFNSRKDIVSFLERFFTDELLNYQIELIDEAFESGILHEENGKLYYCPEWGLNRGTYDMRLTGMKVTQKISDTEYIVTLYSPKDYDYPNYYLETDSYRVKYVDGVFKLSDSYRSESENMSISEAEFNRMYENDYFIII